MRGKRIATGLCLSLVFFFITTGIQYYLRSPPTVDLKMDNKRGGEYYDTASFDLEIKNNAGQIREGKLEVKVAENVVMLRKRENMRSFYQRWTGSLPSLPKDGRLSWMFNIFPINKENPENGTYKITALVRVNGIARGKTEDYVYVHIGKKEYTPRDDWITWSGRGKGLIGNIIEFFKKAWGIYPGW